MVARLNGVQEAAGSNPVTRTKIRRTRESVSVLFWSSFCAAVRRIDPLRSNHWEGKPIPSQTHPMRVGGSCAQTEPAASCTSINGREAAWAASIAAQAAGSNPVTRTKIRRTRESVSVLFWSSFCAAVRRIDPLRSNHWEGKPIPSQTHPMRVGGSCAQTEPAASCTSINGREAAWAASIAAQAAGSNPVTRTIKGL